MAINSRKFDSRSKRRSRIKTIDIQRYRNTRSQKTTHRRLQYGIRRYGINTYIPIYIEIRGKWRRTIYSRYTIQFITSGRKTKRTYGAHLFRNLYRYLSEIEKMVSITIEAIQTEEIIGNERVSTQRNIGRNILHRYQYRTGQR